MPPALDVVDETFVVADPAVVATVLCDERTWASALPGVRLRCLDDRGTLGRRWKVDGMLEGSAEVWLDAWGDGVVVHVYVQADPAPGSPLARRSSHRAAAGLRRAYARPVKALVTELKDRLEAGRPAGVGRAGAATVRGDRVASAELD